VDSIKREFVFVKPVRAAKLLDMSKSKIYEMIQRNEILYVSSVAACEFQCRRSTTWWPRRFGVSSESEK